MWTSKRVPHRSHFSFQQTHSSHALRQDGRREKCVVRRCRRRAKPQRARTQSWVVEATAHRGYVVEPMAPGPTQQVTVQNNKTLHQAQEKMMPQETRQTRDV